MTIESCLWPVAVRHLGTAGLWCALALLAFCTAEPARSIPQRSKSALIPLVSLPATQQRALAAAGRADPFRPPTAALILSLPQATPAPTLKPTPTPRVVAPKVLGIISTPTHTFAIVERGEQHAIVRPGDRVGTAVVQNVSAQTGQVSFRQGSRRMVRTLEARP
ncbi:glr2437 [Gloeobacter violaceus PCC 7421]|uniref:Glr2437 protein n=1 Tax=Gloeobacter violaceus (strain ATCC 29082 / PCC 7421) TaxID=251221 RepID=Q7NHU8_GLOVI|nr:glr2437 [Gloeobacter violaceus PCC 7421]